MRAPVGGGGLPRTAAESRPPLGTVGLTVHYIASVLGAGVLILPGIALELAGPASILSWIALILFSYMFAWVLARLSLENPHCHGLSLFTRRVFGPIWERGIALLLAAAMVTIPPVYGIAAARSLVGLGVIPAEMSLALPATLIMLAGVGLNLAGLRLGLRVQLTLMCLIVGVLVAAVALALPKADAANLAPLAPNGWTAVGTAMALCFFAVIRWENAAPLVEQVRDRDKVLPRAVLLAVTLVGVLYLCVAATAALTRSYGEGDVSPVAALLGAAAGKHAQQLGNAMALVLLVLCANAWILGLTRMLHALAQNGILPAWFAAVRGRDETPVRTCGLAAAAYGLVLLTAWSYDFAEPDIMALTSALFLIIYAVVLAAALKLLARRAERIMALGALGAIFSMIAFHASVVLPLAFVLLSAVALAVTWPRISLRRSLLPGRSDPLRDRRLSDAASAR